MVYFHASGVGKAEAGVTEQGEVGKHGFRRICQQEIVRWCLGFILFHRTHLGYEWFGIGGARVRSDTGKSIR